ncbi:MAG: hypothetical protein MJ105_03415 [Lachnospiraceae bacterium]|nr:hypothetical protein [Lachnospiraceae bacterium]
MNNINTLSTLFGVNNNSPSSNNNILFSSLPSSNNQAGTLGIDFSNYAALKKGSYYKLMKNYYQPDAEGTNAAKNPLLKNQRLATASESLSSAADALADMKYTEDNRNKITEGVEDFVKAYNKTVDNAFDSDIKSVLQRGKWMDNMSKQYSDLLSQVGITIGSDSKFSVNKDTLASANLDDLRDLFGNGIGNFSSKVAYKAEQMYSLAQTNGSSATAYTSNGAFNRDYSQGSTYEVML